MVINWLQQYNIYREPFTNVSMDDDVQNSVYMALDESKDNAILALKGDPSQNGEKFVNNLYPISYIIAAVDRGAAGGPPDDLYADLFRVPILTSSVVICYNLPKDIVPDGKTLQLSIRQIAGIFNGTITDWKDVSFGANNDWYATANWGTYNTGTDTRGTLMRVAKILAEN